jgi:GTP-binding protein LepA
VQQEYQQDRIRNFSIIAHIDHGKSTLADRMLQMTNAVSERDMKDQMLDSMDLERERGITIKASAVRLNYRARDGKDYVLNLIDTPGHVDFGYEVRVPWPPAKALCSSWMRARAWSANRGQCASRHHERFAHYSGAQQNRLAQRRPDRVIAEVEEIVGLPGEEVLLASGKSGIGVEEIFEAIVERVPPPTGDADDPLRALIFDSTSMLSRHYRVCAYHGRHVARRSGSEADGQRPSLRTDRTRCFSPKMTPCESCPRRKRLPHRGHQRRRRSAHRRYRHEYSEPGARGASRLSRA